MMSARIFDQVHKQCIHICSSNLEIMEPIQYVNPAACVLTFLNDTVGICLPTREQWIATYKDNAELLAIFGFVENPGTISQHSMEAAKLNANYRQALRQSHLKVEDGILFYHEPIAGSESYVKLQLGPAAFCNAVFIAFHSNPLGGHLKAVRTLHRMRLRFYWTNMYITSTGCANLAPAVH